MFRFVNARLDIQHPTMEMYAACVHQVLTKQHLEMTFAQSVQLVSTQTAVGQAENVHLAQQTPRQLREVMLLRIVNVKLGMNQLVAVVHALLAAPGCTSSSLDLLPVRGAQREHIRL